jgi:hypothetical protein
MQMFAVSENLREKRRARSVTSYHLYRPVIAMSKQKENLSYQKKRNMCAVGKVCVMFIFFIIIIYFF